MTTNETGEESENYRPKNYLSFEGLVVFMNAVGSLFIVVIMAMICVDIVSRFVFDHPLSGVKELTEIIIVGVVFLQLAHATRLGKLTRSDAAYGILMRSRPRAAHGLSTLYDLASSFLLGSSPGEPGRNSSPLGNSTTMSAMSASSPFPNGRSGCWWS